ncbi:MAG TPA: universal stress protein [Thermomicrobiales bacterium]|nr:universal stress protein [Thermomicrobiales bacterium]
MTGTFSSFRRLLAVVDDVRTDELVLPWAATLATDLKLPLTLLYVSAPGEAYVAPSALAILRSDRRLTDLPVETRHEAGRLDNVLPTIAAEEPGTLVLLPQPVDASQTQRITQWSTYDMLVSMTAPFALIPAGNVAPNHIRSVVVGNDGSELAEQVLAAVRSLGVDVVEVLVYEPEDTDTYGTDPVITPNLIRANGLASRVLLRSARARDAGLIILGSHGLGRASMPLAGRTTEWLLANSDRPVVVVPRS